MKKLIPVLILIAVLLTGCTSKTTNNNTTTTKSSVSNAKITKLSVAPPKELDNIESGAEDIIDDLTKADWTAAQAKVTDIKTNFSALEAKLVNASVSTDIISGINSAVMGLDNAVTSKNSYVAKIQANQISKYVPDIMDYYKTTIPTDVSRLDYLGREIILNVENSDWTLASSNFNKADSLWNSLKLSLKTSYKNDINTFQSNINSLKTAIDNKDSAKTTARANTLLDNVDVLEKDFTAQS